MDAALTTKTWNSKINISLKSQEAILRTSAPTLGLFVLIWIQYSCWIQIWQWKCKIPKYYGEGDKLKQNHLWSTVSTCIEGARSKEILIQNEELWLVTLASPSVVQGQWWFSYFIRFWEDIPNKYWVGGDFLFCFVLFCLVNHIRRFYFMTQSSIWYFGHKSELSLSFFLFFSFLFSFNTNFCK